MNKKRIQWTLALLAAIAVMVLIFFFSGQSVEESDGLSKGLGRKLLEWCPSLNDKVTLSELNHYLRKLAHFTIYFVLGVCLTVAAGRQEKLPPVVVSILIGAAFAASDEIHQIFSDGRGPMVQDVILDSCGVVAGSVLTAACEKLHSTLTHKS